VFIRKKKKIQTEVAEKNEPCF